MERKIILKAKEKAIVRRFLSGEFSTRKAGSLLGMSHQNVINVVCRLAQQSFREGKFSL
jgi:hypothetical protein